MPEREPDSTAAAVVSESIPRLVAMLVHATLARGVRALPEKVLSHSIALCASVALLAPLLLWVSWSKTVFYTVLGTSVTAFLLLLLLVWLHPDDPF